MPVVFLITIAAVLVGIYFVATGRGGEMAYEHADHAPLDLGPVSAADIALLRPPTAMWGYNMQVTDEALDRIARAMRERDVTIAYLQEQLATLARSGVWVEPRGGYVGQVPETPETTESLLAPEIPPFPEASDISAADVTAESAQDPEGLELPWDPEPAADIADAPDTGESAQDPEGLELPWDPEPAADIADAPDTVEFPQAREPDAGVADAPETAVTPEPPQPPRTPLVLKAKAPPAPEPHEVTQPSEIFQDPAATQPSETVAPYETHGPQGAFNTHDWWAEQEQAAREEAGRRQAAAPPEDDSITATEEQGW